MSTFEWIRVGVDDSAAIAALEKVDFDLTLARLSKALAVARNNGQRPVRFVIGARIAKRLERSGPGFGAIRAIYDVPVMIDEDAPDGFGLVVQGGGS